MKNFKFLAYTIYFFRPFWKMSKLTVCMDSLEKEGKAELPKDFINTETMATSKEVMEQAGKVIGNNASVLEQDVKTDLVIEQIEIIEGDQQIVGHAAVIAEPKELVSDQTEADIEVAERVKRVLKSLESTKTVLGLSDKDPENGEGQASAGLGKPDINFDEAKVRIAKICIETEETLKLFSEAEKTLELLEESENILSKLQESLQTLKEEKLSTKNNLQNVTRKLEMAINTSASEFEQLNVDDKVEAQSETTLEHESPESNDPMTETSDPPVRGNGPEPQPTFLQRIRKSMREHYDAFCFISTCSLCLVCLMICSKSGK